MFYNSRISDAPQEQLDSNTPRVAVPDAIESDLSNSDTEDLEHGLANCSVGGPSSSVAPAEVITSCSTGFASSGGLLSTCNGRVSVDGVETSLDESSGGDQMVGSGKKGDEKLPNNTNDDGETSSTKSDAIDF